MSEKGASTSEQVVGEPAWRCRRAVVWFLVIAASLVVADLAVKHYAFKHVAGQPVVLDAANPGYVVVRDIGTPRDRRGFPLREPVGVVPYVLELQLTANTGAVFGTGQGARWFFVTITIVAVVVIGRIFARSDAGAWPLHVGLSLVLAGALGNLYDRVLYGAVRDMFKLFPNVHLPFGWAWGNGSTEVYPWIFNLADVALVVGVGMLIVLMWRADRAEKKLADEKANEK